MRERNMSKLILSDASTKIAFLVEECAYSGVKRVAGKVMDDFNEITDAHEAVVEIKDALPKTKSAVLFATLGNSPLVEKLATENAIDLSAIKDKWEVYGTYVVSTPEIEELLIVVGSDKLGTIYGEFELSNRMGVSPLKYWADATLPKTENLEVEIENGFVAKEPSVKFRGFFINDEWPCYGNWTTDHFGGFTAEMYDHVFELLLRLKGNYLWPAMWSSSFAWDGPGLKSYELADEYGIYIGNSHHEPCLRAGEEYRHVRGKDSVYGDAWNFHTNTEGITRFWRDSMMERGGFTSVVTVGMRGEADSKILGENATLKDNIDLLKKVIVAQKKIIGEAEEKFNKKYPKMLALYKEVEPFYYGDENTEGLCDWDQLDDVIMMLCEDNHGYTRTLPDDKMRNHPAGFGMYYHVDYHGDPISYEWINSTPLTKMWEQMSQAFDYGVRELWILNVGDLKHNEFPLSYFLNLAYDFDKFGTNAPNKTFEYTKDFIKLHFGGELNDDEVYEAAEILTETVRLNGLRRPEALNENIYHPTHYYEADRMLDRVDALVARANSFVEGKSQKVRDTWYSLTGFQTEGATNLLKMHLNAGKNQYYARHGVKAANDYGNLVTQAIARDKEIKKEFAAFKDGKWKGMELAPHIGFIKWNEDGSRYPLRMTVEPYERPRMFVLKADHEGVYDAVYGPCMKVKLDEFMYEGETESAIDICNTGIGTLEYHIDMPECEWLSVSSDKGEIKNEERIIFYCDREKLPTAKETVVASVYGNGTRVDIVISGKQLPSEVIAKLPANTVLPGIQGFVVNAANYSDKHEAEGSKLITLLDYGMFESGVKAYPDTCSFAKGSENYLEYSLYVEDEGEYTVEAVFAPTSPLSRACKLEYGVAVNDGEALYENTVPKGYRSGEGSDRTWAWGVLNHRRVCKTKATLKAGVNTIKILLPDAGLVLLRLNVYATEQEASYLGAPETKLV